jgi:IPT/TIG domain-containing protein
MMNILRASCFLPLICMMATASADEPITVTHTLAIQSGYPHTTVNAVDLKVQAAVAGTVKVLVQGVPATLDVPSSSWLASGVPLQAGIDRVVIQALDAGDRELDRSSIDIWYDTGSTTNVTGTLGTTVWTAAGGPYRLTGNVTVPVGSTLTIEPGATVFVNAGLSLSVAGKLVARGTEYARLRFTRYPGGGNWKGLKFNSTTQPNVLAYADLEFGDNDPQCINIDNSQLEVDRITILHSSQQHFQIANPKVIIRHSVFCDVGPHYMIKLECINTDGWYLFDGNLVGTCTGDTDIMHINRISRKGGPVATILDSVFLGGGDDILDDNETDTHIEGNFFTNADIGNTSRSASAAITSGPGGSGCPADLATQHLTIVRNVFYQNDYGIMNKTGVYGAIFNNVFIANKKGAILFDEPFRTDSGPGRQAYVESCIFWKNPKENPLNLDLATLVYIQSTRPGANPTTLAVNNSLLPDQYTHYGAGNLAAESFDPKFVKDVDLASIPVTKTSPNQLRYSTGYFGYAAGNDQLVADGFPDVHLQPGSPCLASGFNGTDMGVYVPEEATISGVPPSPTALTEATIPVAGLDINGYKFRVLGPGFDGSWSAERQSWKVVSSITVTGTTARATTAAPHGFANGDGIEVEGADTDRTGYDGSFAVFAVTASSFSYLVPVGLLSPATPQDLWCRRVEPIHLTGLADGDYRVEVIRKNIIGIWQDEAMATVGTWTVATGPQPPPAVSSIDPPSQRPGYPVSIAGANFLSGPTVLFGSTASPEVTLNSAGSLTAVVPAIAAGPAPVVVKNSDGKSSPPRDFTVLALPLFIRGDANLDGSVDISDPVAILFHLFAGVPRTCLAAMDTNSSGVVDISDVTFILTALFLGGAAPSAPYPSRGLYTDGPGGLGCDEGLAGA